MNIKDYYKSPDQDRIIELAVEGATAGRITEEIKSSVDDIILEASDAAYEIFLEEEKKSGIVAIKTYLEEKISNNYDSRGTLINKVAEHFSDYDKFFLSLSQARKSRAGKTFEHILKPLFDKCNIPYSFQAVVNGKPDFIIPDRESYLQAPQNTLVVTAKRTVRERWRQIATEGARGFRFYLATIDKKISKNTLDEMSQNQVSLLIPQPVIDEIEIYQNHNIIYSYETLFKKLIPHCLDLWENR